MIRFFKEVFNHFLDSDTFQKGAALAYYAVFSIIPIIIIITSLVGLFFGKEAVAGEIQVQMKEVLGDQAALQFQELIKTHYIKHNSILTSIIGFATLALGASGMLSQIHNAFNKIWNIKEKPKNGILKYLSKHFTSLIILITLFVILIVSTSLNSFLLHFSEQLNFNFHLLSIYEHIASYLVLVLIISIMFKSLGDAKIHWKPAVIGGMITALFFMFGKIGIGLYIGHSHISTTFGAASMIVLLMLWVYYTSQIIFLGASFVHVISEKLGYKITANHHAVIMKESEV